jgi:hypothetical protein
MIDKIRKEFEKHLRDSGFKRKFKNGAYVSDKVQDMWEGYQLGYKAAQPKWLAIDEDVPLGVDVLVQYDDGSLDFVRGENNDEVWESHDGKNKNHLGIYTPLRYMIPNPPEGKDSNDGEEEKQ